MKLTSAATTIWVMYDSVGRKGDVKEATGWGGEKVQQVVSVKGGGGTKVTEM